PSLGTPAATSPCRAVLRTCIPSRAAWPGQPLADVSEPWQTRVARLGVEAAMKSNRSVPAATVIPELIYPDVREAVAWLEAAFGFTERVRIGENHRSQMRYGDGALIVADVRG